MGYYTTFYGTLEIQPPLKPEHRLYLMKFSGMRHYRYDVEKLKGIRDPVREAVGLPLGPDGAFSVVVCDADEAWAADGIQVDPPLIGERPGLRLGDPRNPEFQPNLSPWSPWELEEDEEVSAIRLGQEGQSMKAYGYKEWLRYYIENFFKPWGYTLHGSISYEGDDRDDTGRIEVEGHTVVHSVAKITYEPDEIWSPK